MIRLRGVAVLLMLLVLMLGMTSYLLAHTQHSVQKEMQTSQALGMAREALLAWAFSQLPHSAGGNDGRPGSLPCPDLHLPEDTRAGWQGSPTLLTCNTLASRLGRLPWRTLGIEKLEDGAREPLWYLVAAPFHDGDNSPLNSDSPGVFQAFTQQGQQPLAMTDNRIVAIVFAPGPALASQDRSSTTARLKAANYLESIKIGKTTYNNAATSTSALRLSGPISCASLGACAGLSLDADLLNDRLLVIMQRDLMSVIESRAAHEYQQLFLAHQQKLGFYPWAAATEDAECLATGSSSKTGCTPAVGNCSGHPPKSSWFAAVPGMEVMVGDRNWLYRNRWEQVLHYRIASAACALQVDGEAASGVLVSAGSPRAGQSRALATDRAMPANYLDDVVNQQAWQSTGSYQQPAPASNDRLYRLP